MKAPDKICVAPHQIFDYDLDIQEVGHNGAEDYIRKDYLLEWAEKLYEMYMRITEQGGNDIDFGKMNAFSMLINKLNEI